MTAIILAAGKSNRINLSLPEEKKEEYRLWLEKSWGVKEGLGKDSSFPKVLLPLGEKPVIIHLLETVQEFGGERIIVVLNPNYPITKAVIEKNCLFPNLTFAYQEKPLGTLDAVLACESLLTEEEDILVLCGDTPLLKSETLAGLRSLFYGESPDLVLLTAVLENPFGYGRIVRKKDGIRIVEEREAPEEVKEIKEVNTGVYLFKWKKVRPLLWLLRRGECVALGREKRKRNAPKEYYLTDVVQLLSARGGKIKTVTVNDPRETLGINTLADYEKVRELFNLIYP